MNSAAFAESPLSNDRLPDLRILTFRNTTSVEPTKHVMVFNVENRSPCPTIKTIPRTIASSTETSSVTGSEVSSDVTVGKEDYSADMDMGEVSVDWPPYMEPGEVSVDGPPDVGQFDYQVREVKC